MLWLSTYLYFNFKRSAHIFKIVDYMKAWHAKYYMIIFLLSWVPLHNVYAQTSPDLKGIVQQEGKVVQEMSQDKPVKIAFTTPLKQVSDYWRRSIDSFKARMNEIGLKYEVNEFSTKVDENRKLRECVQLALKTKPDYLVLTPNDPGDEIVISRLLTRRDTKIIIQNMTRPTNSWKDNPPMMYVGFDHTVGATIIAEEFIARLQEKESVKYAMLYHIQDNQVSQLRGDFFNQIIQQKTNFKLVSEYYTDGNRKKAYEDTLKILETHPDIDFIHACSTDIAFGVLDALKEKKQHNNVLVNGWGGGANELKSIVNGGLHFTVMRMNDDNGVAMAEAIRLDLGAKPLLNPIIYSGDMILVRQGMSMEQIMAFKKRAFRYSGL